MFGRLLSFFILALFVFSSAFAQKSTRLSNPKIIVEELLRSEAEWAETLRRIRALPETPIKPPISGARAAASAGMSWNVVFDLVALASILECQPDPRSVAAKKAKYEALDELGRRIKIYNEKKWAEYLQKKREMNRVGISACDADATRGTIGPAGELLSMNQVVDWIRKGVPMSFLTASSSKVDSNQVLLQRKFRLFRASEGNLDLTFSDWLSLGKPSTKRSAWIAMQGVRMGSPHIQKFRKLWIETIKVERNGKIGAVRMQGSNSKVAGPDRKTEASMKKTRERVARAMKSFSGKTETPEIWAYPAAGYDLASLLASLPDAKRNSKVIYMMDTNLPFIHSDEMPFLFTGIPYLREDIESTSDYQWGTGVTHTGIVNDVASSIEQKRGAFGKILGRMDTYFGSNGYELLSAEYFKEASGVDGIRSSHGIFQIRLGDAIHTVIYINGGISRWNSNIHLHCDRKIQLNQLGALGGIFVRGSQGVMQSYENGGENQGRDALLDILAANKGITIEGQHQGYTIFHEPNPEWEISSQIDPNHRTMTDGNRRALKLAEDMDIQHSYYAGIRIIQWGKASQRPRK